MRQECRERFPRHRLQRKPLVSDPTCITTRASLTHGGGENVPVIPGQLNAINVSYEVALAVGDVE